MIDVKIGFIESGRDVTITSKEDAAALQKKLSEAIESGAGVVTIEDDKGQATLVRASSIAWVQLAESNHGKVGFAVGN